MSKLIRPQLTHTHIQGTITLDNYNQVLSNVSGAVRGAATSEQEQTTSNLTVVAAAFERSAALANESVIPNTVSLLLYLGTYCTISLRPSPCDFSGYCQKALRTNKIARLLVLT